MNEETNINLANLLFNKEEIKSVEYYEEKYPYRKEKVVTRFAPSPTGFVHIGSLYTAFINQKYSSDAKGIFFLRIEDTDQNRLIKGSIEGIIKDLKNFNITINEGALNEMEETGIYGPYKQSERLNIYKSFAYHLVKNGLAYPCFCSEKELEKLRETQSQNKERIGYYGKYAKCRNLSLTEIEEKINNGEKYVIRLKSSGNFNNKIKYKDLVKGEVEFPENDIDTILLKSDKYPTYHFAHVIDDHLMRVTHIIRGDEWLSSFPIHYQLFNYFHFFLPSFGHISPLLKKEEDRVRKISKRKDPEAKVSYYYEKGIPYEAVKEYLMTVANTNYEGWKSANPTQTIDNFKFSLNKMSSSGAIFDMDKLLNISKNYLAHLPATKLYDNLVKYEEVFDVPFGSLIKEKKDYTINILNIEREGKKPRKDYAMYSEIKDKINYMYDELFNYDNLELKTSYKKEILKDYIENYYNNKDNEEIWYEKIKKLSLKYGYAKEVKEYKQNPENYKGHVGDVCELIRVSLTSSTKTPDLYQIMNVLGETRVKERMNKFITYLDEKL